MGGQPIASVRPSFGSLGLGGTAHLSLGASASTGELSESSGLPLGADEFDSLDSLGSAVNLADIADTDSRVAGLLVLLDTVLLFTLQSDGKGSPEVLVSLVLAN